MTNKDKIRKAVTALDDEFIEERRRGLYKVNLDNVKWVRLAIACCRHTVIVNVDKIDYVEPEVNRIVVNGEGMELTDKCMKRLVTEVMGFQIDDEA